MANAGVPSFVLISCALVLGHPAARADEPTPAPHAENALTCTQNHCACPNGDSYERGADGQWWRMHRVLDVDVRATMISGFTFLAFGYVLAIANSLAAQTNDDRFMTLIPIAGPITEVWHHGASQTPFTSASLIVSAWSQASGIVLLILSAAAPKYRLNKERVTLGAGPGQAGMSLAVKF